MRTEDNLDYSEEDIQELMKDRRFLAAVHNYALDRLTLGQTITMAASKLPLLPERFNLSLLRYERAIHEVARRVVTGQVDIPKDLSEEYAEIYLETTTVAPPGLDIGAPKFRFSELEKLSPQMSPLTVRRRSFNEDDIRELKNDIRFLACMDAFHQGIISLRDVVERITGDGAYPPRLLSYEAFRGLAHEVMRRVESGAIVMPSTLRENCAFAYEPGTVDDPAYE